MMIGVYVFEFINGIALVGFSCVHTMHMAGVDECSVMPNRHTFGIVKFMVMHLVVPSTCVYDGMSEIYNCTVTYSNVVCTCMVACFNTIHNHVLMHFVIPN